MCGGGSKSAHIEETEDMIAQQQINAKLWNYYQAEYKPLIDKYIAKTTDEAVQEEEERDVAGKINAEIMRNIDPSKVSENPVENTRALMGLGKTGSEIQVQGQGGTRSREIGNIQNIIDIGRGEATQAQIGLEEVASQSVRSAISNKELQLEEDAATEEAYGSVAGAIAAGLLRGSNPKTKSRTLSSRESF